MVSSETGQQLLDRFDDLSNRSLLKEGKENDSKNSFF